MNQSDELEFEDKICRRLVMFSYSVELLHVLPVKACYQDILAPILRQGRLRKNERPLILSTFGEDFWGLITNGRFIWKQNEAITRLAWKDIWSVRVGTEEERAQWDTLTREERKVLVAKCGVIELMEQDDVQHVLKLTPGRNFEALCDAIGSMPHHSYMRVKAKKDPDAWRAHKPSINNRDLIERSALCGCYYCLLVFEPTDIVQWVDKGVTALCPRCKIDSVLASESGYPITEGFLGRMKKMWFSRSGG